MERVPSTRWENLFEVDNAPSEQLVELAHESGQAPFLVDLPDELNPRVAAALAATGIEKLYGHQLQCFDEAMGVGDSRGGNVIVTTGTASGKSLCFNLPVLHTLASDTKARALYLYPTKALAQDQARKLGQLGTAIEKHGRGRSATLRHAIYDGDTPSGERRQIRERSNLVLSNPDMLNQGVLPNHRQWADFFANLAWIVVDEAHVYRGVFGSHVANVLRRLRRIAAAYGTDPRIIMTSATIANPLQLAERLSGEKFQLVDRDSGPHPDRQIAMWNTPLLDEKAGTRGSALGEASSMLVKLVRADIRTIVFMKSRRGVELIHRFATDALADRPDLAEAVMPYRAGYTAAQRREIEQKLASGQLKAVIATSALELGIDIGALDAAIVTTFPGTVASLRQMWGRAGRDHEGLAVYIAGEDALDQFFCRHPDEFLERPVEAAILDPWNESVHLRHLHAAVYELPLRPADSEFFGESVTEFATQLVAAGAVREDGGRWLPRGEDFPAARIALRSASADNFHIVDSDSGEVMGTVEAERAFTTTHPGAVYLHIGRQYEIDELDPNSRTVVARPFTGDWYTQPKFETDTFIEKVEESRPIAAGTLNFGHVAVTEQVIAYQRKSISDHETLSLESLDLPPQHFMTQALWYTLDDVEPGGELPLDVLQGSLHAAEHSQIAVLPLIAMCDRWDIGGLSTAFHPQTGKPTIFIYDGHPGGVGITRRGFEQFERLTTDAMRLIAECKCETGCPSCIQSPKCGNLNEPLHKAGAHKLLGSLIG
ncbi:MAG: DEAD/DEAH box helicase [Solirubrobacterales bacterium]|nr:DEAD/DEAH box helicase [Solirubrobacterales bacterium]